LGDAPYEELRSSRFLISFPIDAENMVGKIARGPIIGTKNTMDDFSSFDI